MITYPFPEITIDAPIWMRDLYKRETGKTLDERYIEMTDECLLRILIDLSDK
jgi:hypothetical protein